MMISHVADVIGIIGVLFVLIAYFLLTTNKMFPYHLSYHLLNFFGSVMILFSLMFAWNTSAVLIEIAWSVVSLLGVYRCLKINR